MNILVIGSGGREHALVQKLAESPDARVYALPGNPGILASAHAVPIDAPTMSSRHHASLIEFCQAASINLVVVGPEAPLAAGIADDLREHNIAVFGPSRAAARVEFSKQFAKDQMARHGIPTAEYKSFSVEERQQAREYVASHPLPVVIKADGLAAGKGVTVAATHKEALNALDGIFDGKFGAAGHTVVVEECMQGEEASVFAISDGENFLTLAAAQDHKRIGDGDTGENTGGMGAYAPAPLVTPEVLRRTEERIIAPMIRAMREEGMPFVGCLYAGLMIDAEGNPRVVEFNARFGDPETQVVLSIFDGNLAALLHSAACGNLKPDAVQSVVHGAACCVVLAAGGYPGDVHTGDEIIGIEQAEAREGVRVFHAGTIEKHGTLVTNGGRVLGVTGRGNSLEEAIRRSYEAVGDIHFRGKTYRTDIGKKGIKK